MTLTIMTIAAMQYLGVPSKWGGQDRTGLDCSGLVVKVCWDLGIKISDKTSQGLYDHFQRRTVFTPQCVEQDCLLFFGTGLNNITHVAIGLDEHFMLEASGATKNCTNETYEDFLKNEDVVKISRIDKRRDLVGVLKVTY